MEYNREPWVARTLEVEGGETFSNRKGDRGGATRWGITHKTLASARHVDSVGPEEVAQLTKAEAESIYCAMYWGRVGANQLPPGIDIEVADIGVTSGPETAVKMLQRILGLRQDTWVGPKTIAACRAADQTDLMSALTRERLILMVGIPGEQNDKGWVNRSFAMYDFARHRIQSQPMLREAMRSPLATAAGGASAIGATGLVGTWAEIGPRVVDWLKDRAGDPDTIDRLQSGVSAAASHVANSENSAIVWMACALLVTSGALVFVVGRHLFTWARGRR